MILWAGIHSDHLNIGEVYVPSRYLHPDLTPVPLCALPAALMGCFTSTFYLFHPYFTFSIRILPFPSVFYLQRSTRTVLTAGYNCLLQRAKNDLRGETSHRVLTSTAYVTFFLWGLRRLVPPPSLSPRGLCVHLDTLLRPSERGRVAPRAFSAHPPLLLPAAMKMGDLQKNRGKGVDFEERPKGNGCC